MPFSPDGVDFSKIHVQKRKSMPVITEGVDVDGKIERGTQVEHGVGCEKKSQH